MAESLSIPGVPEPTPVETEFVLGERQAASVLFVVIVLVAVFSAIAYLAGRSAATGPVKAAAHTAAAIPPPRPLPKIPPASKSVV
ncbi:MAG: hypothetical protein ABI165_19500, partial [Bryobacteraceae bacterium]